MQFDEYQRLALRTASTGNQECMTWRLANWALGLAGEAGETADYLKKVVFHGHQMDKEVLSKELGDVLWYVAVLANEAGLGLHEIATRNIDKLLDRYPDGFSESHSLNRKEANE